MLEPPDPDEAALSDMLSSSSSSVEEDEGVPSDLRSAEVAGPREAEAGAGANLDGVENCWDRNTCCCCC